MNQFSVVLNFRIPSSYTIEWCARAQQLMPRPVLVGPCDSLKDQLSKIICKNRQFNWLLGHLQKLFQSVNSGYWEVPESQTREALSQRHKKGVSSRLVSRLGTWRALERTKTICTKCTKWADSLKRQYALKKTVGNTITVLTKFMITTQDPTMRYLQSDNIPGSDLPELQHRCGWLKLNL
jgi:hypothetical protein